MSMLKWFAGPGINCIILLSHIQFYDDALGEHLNMYMRQKNDTIHARKSFKHK